MISTRQFIFDRVLLKLSGESLKGDREHGVDPKALDFMAGEIEHLIDKVSEDTELIIVEGQGALTNQYYAGVTLGLLHGAMPDYMLMTHDPARDLDVTDYPMATMRLVMDMHLDLMSNFKKSKFIGINLLTFKLSDENAKKEIDKVKEEYSMATTDLIRYGSNELIETIEDLL